MQSHAIDMFKEHFGRFADRKLSRVKTVKRSKKIIFLENNSRALRQRVAAATTADSIVHVDAVKGIV